MATGRRCGSSRSTAAPSGRVVAPALAAQLARPADLGKVPVIEDVGTMLSWSGWFAAAGVPMPKLNGPRYSDPSLAFDAAIAGQGALLAVDLMSDDAVAAGQLIRPFDLSIETAFDYWFITSTARRVPRKVTLFRDWLFGEASRMSAKQFTSSDGVALVYDDFGPADGAPVVLCHGLAAQALQFADDAAFLAGKGHRVLVPDLRGTGDPASRRSSRRISP